MGHRKHSELSEAEPESAHIHSLLTSDVEEGCSGDEDEATKGLYSCNSDIWEAGPYDLPDEQHRCMGWYSHCVSKVSVRDIAGVKQVEQW